MKIAAVFFVALAAAPLFAQETSVVLAQNPDEVIGQIEASWQCNLIGEPTMVGAMLADLFGANCEQGAEGNIVALPSGPNFGLIERLQAVKFPIKEWREALAVPANLIWFQQHWEQPLHMLIMSASYTPADAKSNTLEPRLSYYDGTGDLYNFTRKDIQMFIERRMSEAKASDRREIARIWGEIISTQLALYEQDRLAIIPEPFREKDSLALPTIPVDK